MKLPSSQTDPPRLLDPASGASDAVRALLGHGASELPDAAQIAGLAVRLPAAPPPAPAAPWAIAGPLVGSAIAAAAIAFALVHSAASPPATPPVAPPPPVAAEPAPEAPPEAPRSPILTAEAPSPQRPRVVVPSSGAALPRPAPSAETPAPAPPRDAPGDEAGGEREVDLLQRARAAAPAEALTLVREHERRFPDGALVQEREVIAVGALVGLGRASEARERAARFVERFPRSAYRRRIESLVPPAPSAEP